MKKEKLAEMGVKELEKKYKSQKFMTVLLAAIIIGLFLVVFVFKPESSISSRLLPFAFLPMVLMQIFGNYKLYKELKSRYKK